MSYLHRDALGGLSPVATDPPPPEAAIMDAHRAAIAGPAPDDWQTALAALVTELARVRAALAAWAAAHDHGVMWECEECAALLAEARHG